MKRSPHSIHRTAAVSRNRRRRIFLSNLREKRQARHEVFFNQECEGQPRNA